LGNQGLKQWLLDHGADPNIQEVDGTGCDLDTAALKSTQNTDECLPENGADLKKSSALHAAIRRKEEYLSIITSLLDYGAKVDELQHQDTPEFFQRKVDFGLGTPFQMAAVKGKKDAIKLLFERGADWSGTNTKRVFPARWAKCLWKMDLYEQLK
jgi:ankyrin repeat protein